MKIKLSVKKYFGHLEITVFLNRKAMAIYQLVIDEDGEYETTEVQNSTTANKYHDVRKDVIR
jgi:hypothetical protein